ncbi:MAG: DUF3179 domain-containing protein [Halovenus sp.]
MNVRQVIPKDAIPSVENPAFGGSYGGDPADRMVVLDWADPQRAYPVRYLDFHEIVNDTVGGRPVAVTWCPLCGSAVVYDRRAAGRTLTFGVSGKLADDDLVMYDRETDSEWKQSRGEAIAGALEGTTLTVLPAAMLSWERFRERMDGLVMQPPGGESEAAGEGTEPEPIDYDDRPYAGYLASDRFGLDGLHGEDGREWDREDIDPKTVVLGLQQGAAALGVPLPVVESAGGALSVTVGDQRAVVFATPSGIHAFENPGYVFESVGDGQFRADGTCWDGATGAGDDGRQLRRLPARRLFAFAWQDDHGPDAFLQAADR